MIWSAKTTVAALSITLALVGIFVMGDYFGLFGLKKYLVFDFIEASFKPVNEETGAPIIDVKIRCFQKGNNNACTQKESRSTGIVIVRIPIQKLVWESILFKNKEEIVPPDDPQLQIMFIHYNYNNPVETLVVEDIVQSPVIKQVVKMERKFIEAE
jgi:hypothetical protein